MLTVNHQHWASIQLLTLKRIHIPFVPVNITMHRCQQRISALQRAKAPQVAQLLWGQTCCCLYRWEQRHNVERSMPWTGKGHWLFEVGECNVETWRWPKGNRKLVSAALWPSTLLTQSKKLVWALPSRASGVELECWVSGVPNVENRESNVKHRMSSAKVERQVHQMLSAEHSNVDCWALASS